jgi:hypothetical protein
MKMIAFNRNKHSEDAACSQRRRHGRTVSHVKFLHFHFNQLVKKYKIDWIILIGLQLGLDCHAFHRTAKHREAAESNNAVRSIFCHDNAYLQEKRRIPK